MSTIDGPPRRPGELAALLVVYLALAAAYSLSTPLFEGPDEAYHYPVVQHIAATGALPVMQPGMETAWQQEASQPPLYYLIAAGLTALIDTGDMPQVRRLNPHRKVGVIADPDNKNLALHGPAEAFPWYGTVLAVRLVRLFSLALGGLTVAIVYHTAPVVWPDKPDYPLLAAALVAFNPMFLYLSGVVSNDNLAITLGCWAMLLLARMLRSGITRRRAVTAAVVIALAALTKLSGLLLLPLAAVVYAVQAWRGQRREALMATGLLLGTWLALAGWWYVRNLALYGELLGTGTHIAIIGARTGPPDLSSEWRALWVSFWGLFGAANIMAGPFLYRFTSALSLVALAGVIAWLTGQGRLYGRAELLLPGLLIAQIALTLAGLIRWTTLTYGTQGRLLFPAVGSLALLMAAGLLYLVPPHWKSVMIAGTILPLVAVAVTIPFTVIMPAYEPPPEAAQMPAGAAPIGARFGGLELVGALVEPVSGPGVRLPVTLYLRAIEPLSDEYSLRLTVLNTAGEPVASLMTYPGGGSLPTPQMAPRALYEDHYSIRLPDDLAPGLTLRVRIEAGRLDESGNTFYSYAPINSDGEPLEQIMIEGSIGRP
ncbi:MAG: hypothetical protein Kow00124_04630 [Anaerolineae bacterium]